MTTVTIPPVPARVHPDVCWRKTITGILTAVADRSKPGRDRVVGTVLDPGAVVDLPAGTLVFTYDQTFTRWEHDETTGERTAVEAAHLAAHLVGEHGLTELWTEDAPYATTAFTLPRLKAIADLLKTHPDPGGTVTVLEPARSPNPKSGPCRWCGETVLERVGHRLGRGDDAVIEHWQTCRTRPAIAGTPCAACGVTVAAGNAEQIVVREGEAPGRRETRHFTRLECTTDPLPSWEAIMARKAAEEQTRRDAEAKAAAKRQRAAERRRQQKAAAAAALAAAEADEAARIRDLDVLGERSRALVREISLDSIGSRATMHEIELDLSDGTTTRQWAITITDVRSYSMSVEGDYDVDEDDLYPEDSVHTSRPAADRVFDRLY